MVTPAPARILALRGRLCKDPTDLSAAFPHGGTALGTVKDGEWRPSRRYFKVEAEEYGQAVETIYQGESGVLAVVSRDMDSDFLQATFSPTEEGAATGRRVLYGDVKSEDSRAGRKEGDELAAVVYFSPFSDQQPGVLLYRAVPMIEQAVRINLTLRDDVGLLCMFLATPDESGRTYKIGPRGDLDL